MCVFVSQTYCLFNELLSSSTRGIYLVVEDYAVRRFRNLNLRGKKRKVDTVQRVSCFYEYSTDCERSKIECCADKSHKEVLQCFHHRVVFSFHSLVSYREISRDQWNRENVSHHGFSVVSKNFKLDRSNTGACL